VCYRARRVGELVLITGTSSGIGLSAAIECAAAGHRVVATMRNLAKRGPLDEAAKARGIALDVEQLDVTAEGVGAKVRELVLKYGPFYGLVNNAGIGVGGAFEEQSDTDIRDQFETNVFGLMAVTRAVLPSMRAAQRGRVINVSSLSGRVAFPLVSIYAATKHAVEGFSESLRWELEPFGIEVCLVEPGTFKTSIFFGNQRRGEHVVPDGPYGPLIEAVEKLVLEEAERAPPPDAVGKAIARLLGEAAPRFRSLIGMDARTLVTLRRMVPDRLFASGIRRLLHMPRSR
jgi:NAD(P)-dependent dehydrogenase (short-subunit alcohol dehydrogenase family)